MEREIGWGFGKNQEWARYSFRKKFYAKKISNIELGQQL